MRNPITRRSFLATSLAATALGLTRPAQASYGFRFTCDEQFYEGRWMEWLKAAVGQATLMQTTRVIRNYQALRGNSYNLAGGVWDRSNNANNPIGQWRHYATLLEFQLLCLQINNFQPTLHFKWDYNDQNYYWGKADLSTAAVIYHEDINDVTFDGYFEVALNTYWATTNDYRNNTDVWGGVIAHEMCHNLGHAHGQDEYDDRWPINILDRCVTHRGNYRGGYRSYNWVCGGRINP